MKYRLSKFFSGTYNLLLTFLVLLFIFRPYNDHPLYLGAWKTFLTFILIVAVFNCNHTRLMKWIISILAVPTLVCGWLYLFILTEPVFIASAVFTIIFMLVCTGSIVYDVLLKAKVTSESLRGVICAYFLVALLFAYVYLLMEYIEPGTMRINGSALSIVPYTRYLSTMIYFSFITMLTIGYGDIVAIKEWGQTVTVIEGIIGQFYIAILVARIVSIYSFDTHIKHLKTIEKQLHEK